MILKRIFFILALLFSGVSVAQKQKLQNSDYQNTGVDMADSLRAEGKIYVVVIVLSLILAGLFLYLYRLDRKITRFERDYSDKKE
jgi:hypothetical protein